jgi:hypothetical protein
MGACRPQTPAGSARERSSRLRLVPATLLGALLFAACSPDPSFVDASASTGAGGAAGSGGATSGAGACGDTSDDPANCGSCGHDCLGGECAAGACQPKEIAGAVGDFDGAYAGLAVDATHVYIGDRGSRAGALDGGVLRVSKAEGTVEIVVDEGLTTAWEIAIDDDHVYWTCLEDDTARRVAKNGGPLQLVAADQPAPSTSRPWGVAVDATYVYWAAAGGIWRRAAIGSTDMASDLLVGIAAAGIAVDARGAAFVTDEQGTVVRFDGTAPVTLASGHNLPNAIAVDDTHVYWLDYGDGSVMRADKNAAGTSELLARGDALPTGIALDDSHVYWTTWGDCTEAACAHGTVNRVPKAGGTATIIAEGSYLATDVAVDEDAVYFTTWSAAVFRLAK